MGNSIADILTTQDLSVEDTSELKTGDMRRRHDMPSPKECAKIKDPAKRKRCLAYSGEFAEKKKAAKK